MPSLADIGEVEADSRLNNDCIADGDQSSDSSVEMEKIKEKTKEKWDCESILSKCKMLNGFVLATECIVLRLSSCCCFFSLVASLHFAEEITSNLTSLC